MSASTQAATLTSYADAARMLGVSRVTLDRLLRDPTCDLPRPFKLASSTRRIWFLSDELAAYIATRASIAKISTGRADQMAQSE